jgi:UPF0755 protein
MTWQQQLFCNPTSIQNMSEMPAKKRNPSCLRTFVFILLLFACISLAGGFALVGFLPRLAADDFGPVDRGLGIFERTLYSARLLIQINDLLVPMDPNAKAPVPFRIGDGESVNLIALHLEDAGLIKDASAFRYYLIYSGSDTNLLSGDFSISPTLNAVEIAKLLQDANAKDITFRILAGWRLEEIAAGIEVSGLPISADEFLAAAEDPGAGVVPASLSALKLKSLEGFFLPGTYRFTRSMKVDDVIAAVLKAFDTQVTDDLRQAFARQGLNLYEAVTLASIVQRESMVEDEQPTIASVFYNRLSKGMRLETDPTVQYALGYNSTQKTWWTNPLSLDDLKQNSPYNTYVNPGLPPGPIDSPGLSALRAVAYPAQTPYLYFRAKCDGSGRHNFSTTFEEHLNNECP